jgi:hypothetical protein
MQVHRALSSLLVAAALVGTPVVAAADPAPITPRSAPANANAPKPAIADDVAHYAQLERLSPDAAKFEGGGQGIYIGGGALTVLLVVLLIIIIL